MCWIVFVVLQCCLLFVVTINFNKHGTLSVFLYVTAYILNLLALGFCWAQRRKERIRSSMGMVPPEPQVTGVLLNIPPARPDLFIPQIAHLRTLASAEVLRNPPKYDQV